MRRDKRAYGVVGLSDPEGFTPPGRGQKVKVLASGFEGGAQQ